MQVTLANISTENIKWRIFLDFSCCCNANMYSRMADKLSKGSNSSTFKIDIGVIGMQGKALKYEKLQYWQQKKKKKKKKKHQMKWWVNHIWKKKSKLILL